MELIYCLYGFIALLFAASGINAIIILIQGEVEIRSRFFWVTIKQGYLRGKPAYLLATCQLIGSAIILGILALYFVFGIQTGYWGMLFCGSGLVFYFGTVLIVVKYRTKD